MDTIVYTPEVLPVNGNSTKKSTFANCKWTVNECGVLSILTEGEKPRQVAAFGRDHWVSVIRAAAAK